MPHATSFSRRRALAALALLALAPRRLLALGARAEVVHPDPRPGITAAVVLPDEKVGDAAARRYYAMAREAPGIFDGLGCYCNCAEYESHRSLLACFETTQPAGCGTCQLEARLAHAAWKEGKDLAGVRKAVDGKMR